MNPVPISRLTMDYTPKMADNTMQDRTYLDDAITAREACKLFGIGPDRFLRTDKL